METTIIDPKACEISFESAFCAQQEFVVEVLVPPAATAHLALLTGLQV